MSGLEQLYAKIGEVGNSLLSFFRILLLSKKITPFSQSIEDKELVVLGNGPSLRRLL